MEKKIRFRWGFPFALIVNLPEGSHVITTPAEVPGFQKALNLPTSAVEDWTGLNGITTKQIPQKSKWQKTPRKRRNQTQPHADNTAPSREEPD
ncbi:Hypothetical predicted protein [Pelobates cultripes]|uniref:Uncharacterized protein n=1 Tax=Pelobates cultripes TaxID=61616 RepID=A0AAD1T417_PELCU|nr:Hypothetical predicted protein [Pelobates cultripes]